MAQIGTVEVVATDPATQFRDAIAQNAAAYLDLRLPESLIAGRTARSRLKGIAIVSTENTGWEVWLFAKKTLGAENIAASTFLGFWTFAAADAVRIAAAGLYYYYIDGLDISYLVEDTVPNAQGVQVPDDDGERRNLHLALVARESAKAAGDAGAVKVQFYLEPTLGW